MPIVTQAEALVKLREPFPSNQISKLPKQSKAMGEAVKNDRNFGVNCTVCGGWHHKNAVHLDYVGHAALTDRLLDTDIEWSWEPVSFGSNGLPALDSNNGLWIRLTVQGVTRLGYGSADGKTGGDAIKEIIGDALRNAAMRFGAALDLWHKGDLHVDEDAPEPEAKKRAAKPKVDEAPPKLVSEAQVGTLRFKLTEANASEAAFLDHIKLDALSNMRADKYDDAVALIESRKPKADTKPEMAEIIGDDLPY